ncbi:hypothetical protein PoB_006538100 [Plakobranchus ocellatus]|uniref:Secreted protein n=1 Tax=Plakobranchus ocellatus TaxID=259542 RepID=A0AAV4D3V8_9GAST|nr:hypothetical protein PoB_006538100 [Plakobranchus ocellatus]
MRQKLRHAVRNAVTTFCHNLLVFVWLGADGGANLQRRVPTGFRLSSLSTMPRFCKETALLQDSGVDYIRGPESQTDNATSHCGTLPLTRYRGGTVQAQSRLRRQSQFD